VRSVRSVPGRFRVDAGSLAERETESYELVDLVVRIRAKSERLAVLSRAVAFGASPLLIRTLGSPTEAW
jgi:hypothetical protein